MFGSGCSQGETVTLPEPVFSMQSIQDECREIPEIQNDRGWGGVLKLRTGVLSEVTNGGGEEDVGKESLMMELTRLVQKVMKESSWWEKRGVDCSILTAAFLCLVPGKK